MASPRWMKVARDLWLHKTRSILVVLAVALGSAGAGVVLSTWSVLRQVTQQEFRASNPASATVHTERVDAGLLAALRALPGVGAVQARRSVIGSVIVDGQPRTALLMRIDSGTPVLIGKIAALEGHWPPPDGAWVVEASAVEFANTRLGATLSVRVGDGPALDLPVSGIARDVGVAPGWMEHAVYLFVTASTLDALGASSVFDQVQFTVADRTLNRNGVVEVARRVQALIEASGRVVREVEVPEPGAHIHAGQIDSLLFTQGAFGFLAMLMSCILVINLMTAMLTGQVSEIGVMKALGAQRRQLLAMYLVVALVFGLLALSLAMPVAIYGGMAYARFMAPLLNFSVEGISVPASVVLAQIAFGLALPVLAAAIPVWKGCRISVASALRDVGIEQQSGNRGMLLSDGVAGVSRPLLLSLRNAFRKRQRMLLTLLTLAMGGAVYVGAFNLRAAIIGSVDVLFSPNRFDLTLHLAAPVAPADVDAVVASVPGVLRNEAWGGARVAVMGLDDHGFSGATTVSLSAPAPGTQLYEPRIAAGRWLGDADRQEVVVSRNMVSGRPGRGIGSTLMVLIAGQRVPFAVVGVLDAVAIQPFAYVPRATLMRLLAVPGVTAVMVQTDRGEHAGAIAQRVREKLSATGIGVRASDTLDDRRAAVEDHLLLVANFLAVMGQLMIVVGGMGLASTMGMAVLERTREIGVMRAIGARHATIFWMVQGEGLVIALLGWVLAVPLSVPMSVLLGKAFGRIMFPVPLQLLPDVGAAARWLGVVIVVSTLACAWPAWRAMRVSTARALAYG